MKQPFNSQTLKEFLEKGCDCHYEGRPIAPPYCSQEHMQEGYMNKDGIYFSIPDPNNGDGTYSEFIIDNIIEVNKLEPHAYEISKKEER